MGDLFDRIRTTMPQDNPGKLSRDQYADILAFVLKANGYPAGQKEMDRRSEYLKAIAFVPPPAAGAAKPHASAAAPVQMAQAQSAGDCDRCGRRVVPPRRRRAPRGPQFPPSDIWRRWMRPTRRQACCRLRPTIHATRPMRQPNPYDGRRAFLQIAGRADIRLDIVSVAGDSKGNIWVAERCGANNCAGSPLDPVMEFDAKGNFIKSFGAGMLLFPHDLWIDSHDHLWIADGHVDAASKKGNVVLEFDDKRQIAEDLGHARRLRQRLHDLQRAQRRIW